MPKTFKEVAHHYLGCQCETPTGKAKLTTISLLGKPRFLKGGASVTVGYEWSEVKPLLRDMESMSDEEAIGLCAVVQPLPFSSPRKNKWTCQRTVYKDGEVFILVQCETNDYSFQIDCTDGDVSTYRFGEMEGGSGCAAPFDYLCRHSFNVFNLHSTEYIKINQQQK